MSAMARQTPPGQRLQEGMSHWPTCDLPLLLSRVLRNISTHWARKQQPSEVKRKGCAQRQALHLLSPCHELSRNEASPGVKKGEKTEVFSLPE